MTALEDEKAGYEKLIEFDRSRSAFYLTQSENLWKKLEGLRRTDTKKVNNLSDQINKYTGKVLDLKMKLSQITDHYLQKIKRLVARDESIMSNLKAMESLDDQRIKNEKEEEEEAAHGGLASSENTQEGAA